MEVQKHGGPQQLSMFHCLTNPHAQFRKKEPQQGRQLVKH